MNSWTKRVIITSVIVFAIAISLFVVFALAYNSRTSSDQSGGSTNDATSSEEVETVESCVGDECLAVENIEYPVGELPQGVRTAIEMAIDDEYKAYSTYEAVIAKLGQIRPFSMIIRAEETHIALLKAIFDKYGEAIPANPYSGTIVVADTKQQNCQIGVDAEIANAALYRDQLLPKVKDYPDIIDVFNKLMNASESKHLPAFEKCN